MVATAPGVAKDVKFDVLGIERLSLIPEMPAAGQRMCCL